MATHANAAACAVAAGALAWLCASLPGQDRQASARSDAAVLTTFAWAAPSAVTVVETVFKDGEESKTRYRLSMTRRHGNVIRVRYSDFEFLEVAGQDATTPQMKEQLAAATALASAIPDIHVRADGTFEEATGLEQVMDKVVAFLAESRGWSDQRAAAVRENMRSSGMLDSLEGSVGQYWQSWTGAWLGWTVPEGELREERRKMPVLGQTATADVLLRNLGEPTGHPGKVALELRVRARGREFSKAMAAYVGDLVADIADEDQLGDLLPQLVFSLDETFSVTTDPTTLLPVTAATERVVTAREPADGPEHREVERHHYAFTWDAATAK